jgi:hypothetical protein
MQNYLFAAAALSVLIGIVHSVLGEILIFRKLRQGFLVPDRAAPPLGERHVRILWATWHIVSIFGFAFAAILVRVGTVTAEESLQNIVLTSTGLAFFGASILVLVGTKGRHPGWIGLAATAALIALAAKAS